MISALSFGILENPIGVFVKDGVGVRVGGVVAEAVGEGVTVTVADGSIVGVAEAIEVEVRVGSAGVSPPWDITTGP
jgi:hypothetical protein